MIVTFWPSSRRLAMSPPHERATSSGCGATKTWVMAGRVYRAPPGLRGSGQALCARSRRAPVGDETVHARVPALDRDDRPRRRRPRPASGSRSPPPRSVSRPGRRAWSNTTASRARVPGRYSQAARSRPAATRAMSAIGMSQGIAVADRPPSDCSARAFDRSPNCARYERPGQERRRDDECDAGHEERAPAQRQGDRHEGVDLEEGRDRAGPDQDQRHEQVLRVPVPGRVKERWEEDPPPWEPEQPDRRDGARDRKDDQQRDADAFGQDRDRCQRDERRRRGCETLGFDGDPRVCPRQPGACRRQVQLGIEPRSARDQHLQPHRADDAEPDGKPIALEPGQDEAEIGTTRLELTRRSRRRR